MTKKRDAAHSIIARTGIPAGWNDHTVGDFVHIVGGGTPDRNESSFWRGGTIPWITPTDLTANSSKFISAGAECITEAALRKSNATLVPKGSIVFSTRGTVGNMAIAARPLTTNQSCENLVPLNGVILSNMLYYLLSFGLSAFIRLSEGTTFGAITRRDIARVHFAVPDLDEQKAIVLILDAVDTAIEKTHMAAERAQDVRRSILQRFFRESLGETAYADRPKRRLPSKWSLTPTGQLLEGELKNGISPRASSQPPGIPTFSIAAIRDGRINLTTPENLKYIEEGTKVPKIFCVRRGDILIVRGNANPDLVAKAGMVSDFPSGCVYPDITKRVIFRSGGEGTVLPDFALLAWNHPVVHNQLLRRAKTSNGTLKINSRDVQATVLPVPPLPEQSEIVRLIAAVETKAQSLMNLASRLEVLKKSMMDDLLSGRVRINMAKVGGAA